MRNSRPPFYGCVIGRKTAHVTRKLIGDVLLYTVTRCPFHLTLLIFIYPQPAEIIARDLFFIFHEDERYIAIDRLWISHPQFTAVSKIPCTDQEMPLIHCCRRIPIYVHIAAVTKAIGSNRFPFHSIDRTPDLYTVGIICRSVKIAIPDLQTSSFHYSGRQSHCQRPASNFFHPWCARAERPWFCSEFPGIGNHQTGQTLRG